MTYSVDYEKLSGEIDPAFFQQYLQENGWTPFKTKREDVSVFQYIQADQFEQVDIPCDRALFDYDSALYQAVETVANVEGKTVDQMLRALLGSNREKAGFQCGDIQRSLADKEKMLAIIRRFYFEAGVWTEADEFFERLRKKRDVESPLKMLSDIANHNSSNVHVLEGVLHILSNYNYSEIDPYVVIILRACAVNHSPIIQDLLISCFEKWEAVEFIDVLESLKLDEYWLTEYRDDVVKQLKQKGEPPQPVKKCGTQHGYEETY